MNAILELYMVKAGRVKAGCVGIRPVRHLRSAVRGTLRCAEGAISVCY